MSAADLVARVTDGWEADPASDVVWAGDHEGRRGVRMRQTVRDFTTVWFQVGERTVGVEAYVLPAPPPGPGGEEAYRQCLTRNYGTRRIHFALDREDGLVLIGRIPVGELSDEEMELALGEVYSLVEASFRSLLAAGFGREKNG